MKIHLLLAIQLLLACQLQAQKRDNVWVVGHGFDNKITPNDKSGNVLLDWVFSIQKLLHNMTCWLPIFSPPKLLLDCGTVLCLRGTGPSSGWHNWPLMVVFMYLLPGVPTIGIVLITTTGRVRPADLYSIVSSFLYSWAVRF